MVFLVDPYRRRAAVKSASKIALVVTGVEIAAVTALWLLGYVSSASYEATERRYTAIFMAVPEVEAVDRFLEYEGKTSAGLNIKGGGYLYISAFDESVGTSTDRLSLYQIGDIAIACSDNKER